MRSQVRFLLAPPTTPSIPDGKVPSTEEAAVKFIRQALIAISLGSMVAAVLRRRTKVVVAPQQGGWREVTPQR